MHLMKKDDINLEVGSTVQVEDKIYTVDKDGNLIDEEGKIFKEAKDVKDWIKSFETVDEGDEIIQSDEHSWLVDARINVEDLNDRLGLKLPDDGIDTLGGFVFNLFGKIPVRYEKTSYENIDFIIQEIENHKIKVIKIVVDAKRER